MFAIKEELGRTGRTIAEDHYGISLPLRFGSPDDKPVQEFVRAIQGFGLADFDPGQCIAVGDGSAITDTLERYRARGISKFVAIPLANSEADAMAQVDQLCESVIPWIGGR